MAAFRHVWDGSSGHGLQGPWTGTVEAVLQILLPLLRSTAARFRPLLHGRPIRRRLRAGLCLPALSIAAIAKDVPMSRMNLNRCLVALSLLLPVTAHAQNAFTTQAVNVRAGPDRAFPRVTWLQAGTPVNVIGCTNGWRWCDVVARGWRGWVYSRYLSGPIRGRAPVITFSVGSYWDAHYRGRPWYSSRSSWNNWGSPGFRPPPPPPPRPPVSRSPGRPPGG